MSLTVQIITAIGAGISAGAMGYTFYMKNTKKEDFDYAKMGRTTLTAFGLAFICCYFRTPENVIVDSPIYGFAGLMLENVLKYIKRKYGNQIKKWFR